MKGNGARNGITQDAAAALHLIEPCGSLARFRDGKLDMFDVVLRMPGIRGKREMQGHHPLVGRMNETAIPLFAGEGLEEYRPACMDAFEDPEGILHTGQRVGLGRKRLLRHRHDRRILLGKGQLAPKEGIHVHVRKMMHDGKDAPSVGTIALGQLLR